MSTSILETVCEAIGLEVDDNSFNAEINLHINSALATLFQNGIGKSLVVQDFGTSWNDFKDETQTEGNLMFEQVKLYVFIKTKLLFDPPPPSTVKPMTEAADEILWRLREQYTPPVVVADPLGEEV